MPEPKSVEETSSRPASDEFVWTYRGYRIRPGEFVTAMVHFFRAEIQRANVWRQRLDTTTNWAVITTAGTLSIAFSQASSSHVVILMNTLLVSLFLYIEARRYRYYELWSYRVRLIEADFYAAMLVPPFQPSPEWAESLAESLLHPRFPISMWEALGRRLRRNYFWLFLILALVWLSKLWMHPVPAADVATMIERAAIGGLDGRMVVLLAAVYYVLLLILGLLTAPLAHATGEVLPRFGQETRAEGVAGTSGRERRAWFLTHSRRRQFLAFVITDKPDAVSQAIMNELRRGVTCLHGKGMYTGAERNILMCALTVTEINHLKIVTAREDPSAFVVISSAQEVLGRGFLPLERP